MILLKQRETRYMAREEKNTTHQKKKKKKKTKKKKKKKKKSNLKVKMVGAYCNQVNL